MKTAYHYIQVFFSLFKRVTISEMIQHEITATIKEMQTSKEVIEVYELQQKLAYAKLSTLTAWKDKQKEYDGKNTK